MAHKYTQKRVRESAAQRERELVKTAESTWKEEREKDEKSTGRRR